MMTLMIFIWKATKGNLWDIRLAIFVKPMHLMQISQVKQSVVKLGLANALGKSTP